MKTNRNNRYDYTVLKRKLFGKALLTAVLAIADVLIFRSLTTGKLGDAIVNSISKMYRIDYNSAFSIYSFGIRNYLEVLIVIAIIVLFLILFRLLINSFTHYFDEIVVGIDQLIEGDGAEIRLSPELDFVEHKLCKLQQTLERRESAARQSEQRKNDLVIYSAHDVKTPLTSVLGYLMLLDGDPQLPAGQRVKYTGIALDKARELDAMISELFEITRYNLHDIALEKVQIDLYSMLVQIKEELFPLLEAENKKAVIHADENISVWGDPDKLARVFANLLKNAAAYSEPDSAIDIFADGTADGVTVTLRNQSHPIPQDKLDRLFDQFYRLDSTGGGSGLGLAIVKEIVLLHGGTIRAESREGFTSFIVTLPSGAMPY